MVFLACQRDFCDFLAYLVTSASADLPENVQEIILSLIQSWALAYSSDRKLRGVAEVYMILKDKEVAFPEPSDEDLKDTDVGFDITEVRILDTFFRKLRLF